MNLVVPPEMNAKPRQGRLLNSDSLYRISYLIGIYKALNILFGEKLANEWIQLPNENQLFGGLVPIVYGNGRHSRI